MILENTSARTILCGPYKLIPLFPVKVAETKRELVKRYPRMGELIDDGTIVCVKSSDAEKTEAKTKEKTAEVLAEAREKEAEEKRAAENDAG